MNHLSLHPTLRTCSSDTILRAIKELTQENILYTSDSGKNYDFNTADTPNTLLLNCMFAYGQLKEVWMFYDYNNILYWNSSLELYRVAYEKGEANGKKILILAGKAQPKMQFWCEQWECYGTGALFRLGVCILISASMFNGLTKQLVKIAKKRAEKQAKVRFLFQILLFLHHNNGFRTYR